MFVLVYFINLVDVNDEDNVVATYLNQIDTSANLQSPFKIHSKGHLLLHGRVADAQRGVVVHYENLVIVEVLQGLFTSVYHDRFLQHSGQGYLIRDLVRHTMWTVLIRVLELLFLLYRALWSESAWIRQIVTRTGPYDLIPILNKSFIHYLFEMVVDLEVLEVLRENVVVEGTLLNY